MACNLIYTTVCTYLLFFYTNVYGLPAEIVATMFLVVRVMDAVVDPIVGTFVDKHTFKYGKFRPYLLYGAFPFAISFDTVPTTVEMLKTGLIKATIYQPPYRQGFSAVNKAFEYLVHGHVLEKELCIMKNEIKLFENL